MADIDWLPPAKLREHYVEPVAVDAQDAADRKLKPLPPDLARHQDLAIARGRLRRGIGPVGLERPDESLAR